MIFLIPPKMDAREGKNADEMFEDIGHSGEARNQLKKYLIGKLRVRKK
jgi:cytochrome b involved in lipid metabolism